MEDMRKIELLADLFEVPEDSLTAETVLADLEEWNSMSKLSLIVLMDDEFNKKLTGEQIREFVTIGDILNFMD